MITNITDALLQIVQKKCVGTYMKPQFYLNYFLFENSSESNLKYYVVH